MKKTFKIAVSFIIAAATYGDSRVVTKWTRAYEYNDAGTDVPKGQSNRYCHNMMENGLDRVIT